MQTDPPRYGHYWAELLCFRLFLVKEQRGWCSGCHAALSSLGNISAPAAELREQALSRLPVQMSSPRQHPIRTQLMLDRDRCLSTPNPACQELQGPLQKPSQTQVVWCWVGGGLLGVCLVLLLGLGFLVGFFWLFVWFLKLAGKT